MFFSCFQKLFIFLKCFVHLFENTGCYVPTDMSKQMQAAKQSLSLACLSTYTATKQQQMHAFSMSTLSMYQRRTTMLGWECYQTHPESTIFVSFSRSTGYAFSFLGSTTMFFFFFLVLLMGAQLCFYIFEKHNSGSTDYFFLFLKSISMFFARGKAPLPNVFIPKPSKN